MLCIQKIQHIQNILGINILTILKNIVLLSNS